MLFFELLFLLDSEDGSKIQRDMGKDVIKGVSNEPEVWTTECPQLHGGIHMKHQKGLLGL